MQQWMLVFVDGLYVCGVVDVVYGWNFVGVFWYDVVYEQYEWCVQWCVVVVVELVMCMIFEYDWCDWLEIFVIFDLVQFVLYVWIDW